MGMFLYVAQAVEHVLAAAFGKKTVLFRVTLSACFFMQPRQLNACQHLLSETNCVCWCPTISIFLYVTQAVERVLEPAFGKKLCWFESHLLHISLCSPGSKRRGSSSLWKQTMLVRVPLTAYFFMQPRQQKAWQQQPSETNYVGSSPTYDIFLYVAQAVQEFWCLAHVFPMPQPFLVLLTNGHSWHYRPWVSQN